MIHDIIEMPIQIPPREPVEMASCMFLGPPGSDDHIYFLSRDLEADYGSMYRYKLIEQHPGAWIERSFISFDELDLFNMKLVNPAIADIGRLPSINLYPITTKVHEITPDGVNIRAYRHFSSIKEVLHTLCGMEVRDLFSIHHLFIHAVATSLMEFNELDFSDALMEFAESNRVRLKSVISADDDVNSNLITCMNDLSNYRMLDLFANTKQEFVELVETFSKLPVVAGCDQFTRWMGIRPYIESINLYPHLSPTYGSRRFSVQIATQDIFPVDHTINYHSDPKHRWDIAPLINLLELLPYTDLSLEFGPILDGCKRAPHVHYAISMFGPVQEFQTMLYKDPTDIFKPRHRVSGVKLCHLEFILRNFIKSECITQNPEEAKISLVKTFCDDVYIDVECSGIHYQYYFDLTLFALGSKGVVDMDLFNVITSQGSAFWKRMNELRRG